MFRAWPYKNKDNRSFIFKARLYKFTSVNEKLIEVSFMFKAWPYKNKANRGFTFKARLHKFTSANGKLIQVFFVFKAWPYKITSVNIKLVEASCSKRGFISF